MRKIDKNIVSDANADEMLSEYYFDFSKAKPNRFAPVLKAQERLVQLEPDVFSVFDTSDKVNKALRAFISAMPIQSIQNHSQAKL